MDDLIDLLEPTRLQLDVSVTDLWWRYFALGGTSSEMEIDAILYRALVPTVHDYDLLAVALNERSVELGGTYILPYSTDLPNP